MGTLGIRFFLSFFFFSSLLALSSYDEIELIRMPERVTLRDRNRKEFQMALICQTRNIIRW